MVFLLFCWISPYLTLKDINSLRNTSEFKEVYEHGISAANSLLAVYALSGEGDLRLGISVSKKVGNSVVRHRVTRMIRESFRKLRPELVPGCSIVVVARVRAGDKEKGFSDIYGAMRYLCRKLKVYRSFEG